MYNFFACFQLTAASFAKSKRFSSLPAMVQESLRVSAGGTYILALIAVNMLGYGVGVGGLQDMVAKASSREGLWVLGVSYYFLCWGVRLMDYLQELGVSSA